MNIFLRGPGAGAHAPGAAARKSLTTLMSTADPRRRISEQRHYRLFRVAASGALRR